jgi:hypothetical protein
MQANHLHCLQGFERWLKINAPDFLQSLRTEREADPYLTLSDKRGGGGGGGDGEWTTQARDFNASKQAWLNGMPRRGVNEPGRHATQEMARLRSGEALSRSDAMVDAWSLSNATVISYTALVAASLTYAVHLCRRANSLSILWLLLLRRSALNVFVSLSQERRELWEYLRREMRREKQEQVDKLMTKY